MTASTLTDAPGAKFVALLGEGKFHLQVCRPCGTQVFFPRSLCPACGSVQLEWRAPSGRGTVYSTTIVRQRPDRGGDYNVALIELAEGARMMSRVEGIPPELVTIGMEVQAHIVSASNEPLVVFRPVSGAAA